MSVLRLPLEEVEKEIRDKLDDLGYENYFNTVVLAKDTQNDVIKLEKPSVTSKFAHNVALYVIVNEEIYDQLPDKLKHLLLIETLTALHFDPETEKLTINKPDMVTYSGFISKYGLDTKVQLMETIKSLRDKKKNEKNSEPTT